MEPSNQWTIIYRNVTNPDRAIRFARDGDRHTGHINVIKYFESKNIGYFVTAAQDKSIRLWVVDGCHLSNL